MVDRSFHDGKQMESLPAVSFDQITRILEVTDRLGISREWVEIPLSTGSPGVIRRLANGKVEIVVDAQKPFDAWLQELEPQILTVLPPEEETSES